MNQANFRSVWYASEDRMRSPYKFVVFDDRGRLETSPEQIKFSGKKQNISISKESIRDISLKRQRVNWVTYLILDLILVIYILFVGSRIGIDVTYFLVLLVVLNAIGLLIGMNTKWVLVEYEDQDGVLKKAYFADGSVFGWSGFLGGTRRIFKALKP